MAYNFGTPEPGYTLVSGSFDNMARKMLPKDTVRYRIVRDGWDTFGLWLWITEYFYIGDQEFERWYTEYYTSSYNREYYTIYAEVVHNVTRTFLNKKVLYVNKATDDNRFYDPSLEEKLGGEVMTLGG